MKTLSSVFKRFLHEASEVEHNADFASIWLVTYFICEWITQISIK
jgi:hypothetical protein